MGFTHHRACDDGLNDTNYYDDCVDSLHDTEILAPDRKVNVHPAQKKNAVMDAAATAGLGGS